MKPIEVKLSLTKQQEEAAYIMERLDELATVLMDVYNGKEKLEAVETVASALHNNIRYKVGSLVTDGGRKRQTMTITVNDYRLSVGAAADKEIRHQVRALVRRYKTFNPFALAALAGITTNRITLPHGIRAFSLQGGKPQPGKPAFLSTSPANTHQLQMGSCSTIFYLLRIESGCSLSDH